MDRTELMLEASAKLIDSIDTFVTTIIAQEPVVDVIKIMSIIFGEMLGNLVNLGGEKTPDVKDCFSGIAISIFHENYDNAMKEKS